MMATFECVLSVPQDDSKDGCQEAWEKLAHDFLSKLIMVFIS